ncbi:MAG: S41 family peptidase [Candidatus Obscuribacterales bacterium]|nr:S41 family peptidase [Candidatus Obscuribacterales bacterium]
MKKTLSVLSLTALLAVSIQAQASPYQSGDKRIPIIAAIYDGRGAYTEVYDFITSTHLDLVDPAVRRQWNDRWNPSNVSPSIYQSRQATEAAIKNMMQSLRRKHDMFLSQADTSRQTIWMEAHDTVRTTMLKNNIALVKIPSFLPKTVDRETQIAIAHCSKAQAIILDLRGNTGGLVTPALNVAATLIPEGLIYVAKARVGDQIEETRRSLTKTQWVTVTTGSNPVTEYATRTQLVVSPSVPVVVLVDRQTASAAELLTGALKQSRRAVILVGTRTYGKGTGNRLTHLSSNGRSLQITHEKLFPGGLDTDGVGILPDVVIDQPAGSSVDYQLDAAVKALTRSLLQAEAPMPPPAKSDQPKKPYGGSPYVRLY